MIPLEVGHPSLRVENFNDDDNSERLKANLGLLEEVREHADIGMAAY